MDIPARRVATFSPSKAMRERIDDTGTRGGLMAKKTKKFEPIPVISLSDIEEDHLATLSSEKELSDFLNAMHAYRERLVTKVLVTARAATSNKNAVEQLFQKVRAEAGEVAAATYVRLFFPQVESFFSEVAQCFTEGESPKAARKAMYKTKAWQREVQVTQKLIQYPLHK